MEPIQVTARFDPNGEIQPESFQWKGREYPVVSTGRQWFDEKGCHVLVMDPDDQVYELIFVPAVLIWYMGSLGVVYRG
jgi:hypothetical protein